MLPPQSSPCSENAEGCTQRAQADRGVHDLAVHKALSPLVVFTRDISQEGSVLLAQR